MTPSTKEALLMVDNLVVNFAVGHGVVHAVDGVSFNIRKQETVALVGESGCGKSVTALSLAKLVPSPGSYASGQISFEGRQVLDMDDEALRRMRGNDISYIFQEPSTSLNPVFTVGFQIGEAIKLHRPGVDVREEVIRLLDLVGIPDPEQRLEAYPHELSGGMQQRVMIAMALACDPKLLIADEPTTALDVTIQAQILELLGSLQERLGMSVLLITHNLGLVADIAHWVHVMYAGRIVESGPTERVLGDPKHPYTQGLLRAVPRLEAVEGRLQGIPGSVPNPAHLPDGCKFHPRCEYAQEVCKGAEPRDEVTEGGQSVRCHLWKNLKDEISTTV